MKMQLGGNKDKSQFGNGFVKASSLESQLAKQEENANVKKPHNGPSLKSLLQPETLKPNADQPVTSAISENTALATTQGRPSVGVNTSETCKAKTVKPEPSEIPTLAPITEKYVLNAEASEILPIEVIEGFSTRMQMLIDNMNSQELPTVLHDLLKYTQANKNLRPILRETDVQLFVRACRHSYGLVVTKKTANKAKKAKAAIATQDIIDDLAGLEFSL